MPLGIQLLLTALFVVPGALFIFFALRNKRRAAASLQWPHADGRITQSSLKTWKDDENGDRYEPKVEYVYQLDGNEYTGNRIAFGSSSTADYKKAQEMVSAYAINSPVTVYYDPVSPGESVLTQSASSSFAYVFIGGVLLILGLVVPVVL